jgi:group I intron endonuclease
MIIYLLRCTVSGKAYIGQSIHSLEDRWKIHLKDAKRGAPYMLHKAIRKYGPEAFEKTVLQEVSAVEELNTLEIYYIKTQNTKVPFGYNMTDGGEGHKGQEFSLEHRRKLSESLIGNKHTAGHVLTEEHKSKVSIALKGKTRSAEARANMSIGQKGNQKWLGRKHSPETIEKCRIARTKYWERKKTLCQ